MKAKVFIDGLYEWGHGSVSKELDDKFNSIVVKFTTDFGLELAPPKNWTAAMVGKISEEDHIYFHPMSVDFCGKYTDLVYDFADYMNDSLPFARTRVEELEEINYQYNGLGLGEGCLTDA